MAGYAASTRSAPNVAVPLHSLFEAVSDGVLITDMTGHRTYANRALGELLGTNPLADAGPAAPTWLPEAHRQRFHEVIGRIARSEPGDEIVVLEWAILDVNGAEQSVIVRLFPVRSNGGDKTAVLWLIQPVDLPSAGRDEWSAALERIALEVARLGFGGSTATPPVSHGYEGADRLTPRERDVVRCLLEGDRVVTVAERLDLSPHTVRNHLKSIFRKLGVHSQAELVKHVRG
jgi:PAS domain S-box-containing protein